jgi:hypothetical protein
MDIFEKSFNKLGNAVNDTFNLAIDNLDKTKLIFFFIFLQNTEI